MKTTNKESEEKKAAKNSFALYRKILRIDHLIASELYPSIQDFIDDDEIGGSRATIFRLLERMKIDLNAPIEFSKDRKGYYYSQRAFRLPAVFTTEQELFATAVLKNMCEKLNGTPLYKNAQKMLEMIEDSTVKNPMAQNFLREFEPQDKNNIDWANDRYIFLGDTYPAVDQKVWDAIKDAMRNSRKIKIKYWDYEYTVCPYQALYSECSWYLWGYNDDDEDLRLFLMDEIEGATVLKDSFVLPKNFAFTNYSSGALGAFRGDVEYDFKIEFYGWAMRQAAKTNFGKNLKRRKTKDKITVTFTASELLPILSRTLSFGKYAKPLAPKELVDLWKENIEEMKKG